MGSSNFLGGMIQNTMKLADAGLPNGAPGLTDAMAGHPLSTPPSAVSAGGMPGMPTPQAGGGPLDSLFSMGGMRGKGNVG